MARSYIQTNELIRIAITIVLLVAVVVMKQRCGKAAIEMFKAIDTRSDGGATTGADAAPPRALTPNDATH